MPLGGLISMIRMWCSWKQFHACSAQYGQVPEKEWLLLVMLSIVTVSSKWGAGWSSSMPAQHSTTRSWRRTSSALRCWPSPSRCAQPRRRFWMKMCSTPCERSAPTFMMTFPFRFSAEDHALPALKVSLTKCHLSISYHPSIQLPLSRLWFGLVLWVSCCFHCGSHGSGLKMCKYLIFLFFLNWKLCVADQPATMCASSTFVTNPCNIVNVRPLPVWLLWETGLERKATAGLLFPSISFIFFQNHRYVHCKCPCTRDAMCFPDKVCKLTVQMAIRDYKMSKVIVNLTALLDAVEDAEM